MRREALSAAAAAAAPAPEAELEQRNAAPPKPTVKVGRYVVRNDNAAWVASANAFWTKLSTTSPNKANYVNSQYCKHPPILLDDPC